MVVWQKTRFAEEAWLVEKLPFDPIGLVCWHLCLREIVKHPGITTGEIRQHLLLVGGQCLPAKHFQTLRQSQPLTCILMFFERILADRASEVLLGRGQERGQSQCRQGKVYLIPAKRRTTLRR